MYTHAYMRSISIRTYMYDMQCTPQKLTLTWQWKINIFTCLLFSMFILVFGGVMIYLYTCSPTSSNLSKSQVPRHDLVAVPQETANRRPKTSKGSLPRQPKSANPPVDTVDGRNPAPPGMYKTLQIMGQTTYELVLGFLHQQYCQYCKHMINKPLS